MNVKIIVQIILSILILVIFYLFYSTYFKNNDSDTNKIIQEQNAKRESKLVRKDASDNLVKKEESSNLIENIEYKSSDRKGNQYILTAKTGETNIDNKNIMKLQSVNGKIILVGRKPIFIYSNHADYNTENYDTKFYDNVEIQFEDNKVKSNNFDLFIKDNIAKIYNNVQFDNIVSKLNADIINIDLLEGNINVDMFDKSNKVKWLKK